MQPADTPERHRDIIHVISYTCVFPAVAHPVYSILVSRRQVSERSMAQLWTGCLRFIMRRQFISHHL